MGAGGSIAGGGGDPTPTQLGPWPSPGWQFGVCVCVCVVWGWGPHTGEACASSLLHNARAAQGVCVGWVG